ARPVIGSCAGVAALESEPAGLLALPAAGSAAGRCGRSAHLPGGGARVPLKEVHTNRCPALVQWNRLRPADFDRLGIDPVVAEARAARIRAHGPAIAEKVRRVFIRDRDGDRPPPALDAALYDGLIRDRRKAR